MNSCPLRNPIQAGDMCLSGLRNTFCVKKFSRFGLVDADNGAIMQYVSSNALETDLFNW